MRLLSSLATAAFACTAVVGAYSAPANACGDEAQMAIQEVSVPQLREMMAQKRVKKAQQDVTVVDVNSKKTRERAGVIPGAVLLTSSSRYDAAKELPQNKDDTLVFYCSNEKCSASKTAAKRAVGAGHKDVRVLPAGIKGWKSAGLKTDVPRS